MVPIRVILTLFLLTMNKVTQFGNKKVIILVGFCVAFIGELYLPSSFLNTLKPSLLWFLWMLSISLFDLGVAFLPSNFDSITVLPVTVVI